MILGEHATEDSLEGYCLGTFPVGELECLENHVLVCPQCQDRLHETEIYVRTLREAASRLAREEQAEVRHPLRRFTLALAAAAMAAVTAIVVVPSRRVMPVAVALESTRGADQWRGKAAPASKPLLLTLDLTGVVQLPSYRVRLVDAVGRTVFEAPAKQVNGRLPPQQVQALPGGVYWVRLYNPADPRSPLREFGLRVE